MKNLYVIPTPKPSRLRYNLSNVLVFTKELYRDYGKEANQNIYITSNDEIKEGDWCIADYVTGFIDSKGNPPKDEKYHVVKPTNIVLGNVEHGQALLFSFNNLTHGITYCKKIILTDNEDLIKDGVQAIDNEFLEWFVKNPSCEFVEFVKEKIILGEVAGTTYTDFNYKIIIPKEELKTSEEWQKQFPNTKVLDPDGWDRKNYQYSWFEEKITLVEYTTRLYKSSGQCLVTQEEDKQEESLITLKKEVINGLNELLKLNNSIGNFGKPQEESKQETLEEAANKYVEDFDLSFYDTVEAIPVKELGKKDFIEGAKWQAERMYSEEEIAIAFNEGQAYSVTGKLVDGEDWVKTHKKEWFEQHKNKL